MNPTTKYSARIVPWRRQVRKFRVICDEVLLENDGILVMAKNGRLLQNMLLSAIFDQSDAKWRKILDIVSDSQSNNNMGRFCKDSIGTSQFLD